MTDLHTKLRTAPARYAATGTLAASRRTPVAAPGLASLCVDNPETFAAAVELRPAHARAHVLLLVPDDAYPFEDAWTDNGVRFAMLAQEVADLLTGPGRGPAEAVALLAWMGDHVDVWRG